MLHMRHYKMHFLNVTEQLAAQCVEEASFYIGWCIKCCQYKMLIA